MFCIVVRYCKRCQYVGLSKQQSEEANGDITWQCGNGGQNQVVDAI